ncbi:carbohydrate ABC transporter permease [Yinghuangia seranimata]|uniref:carbohydrate ABC transporter permease n=1 Tax=Yinghuangia seranimata TaxID=408067 RepID=UPI00248AEB99|nr:carbohydrate ABC transporter permease [Yinghuangia seranimata]MDI2128077.1 carbohydrate ABC transporter permease [Yinghuangia seranimata]
MRFLKRFALNQAAFITFVFMIFPVYWMVLTAIKPGKDIQSETPKFVPSSITFESFKHAIDTPHFADYWRNSLLVAVGGVGLSLVIACFAAFAVARMQWKGRASFILMVFIAQMAPWEALMIPMYLIARDNDMLDNLPFLTAIYFVMTLPFAIVTLRGFLAGIPVELEEAARVDGCSRFTAFRKVVFPLLAPGLLSTSLFGFITAWNEFAFANALLINNEDQKTLPTWLSSFSNGLTIDWGAIMAASTLFMLPVLAIFLVLQGKVTGGMTSGAVKG